MIRRSWLLLPLLLGLAGCPANTPGMPDAYATPGTLGDLVQQSQSANAQLAQNLNTPLKLSFPVRLGVLFYQYDTVLEPEDQQSLLDKLEADLATPPGLVRSTVVVPSSLISSDLNLDDIRQLVSRFRIDTLLIVSGTDSFDRTASSGGLFGQFSNAGSYEARTALTALGMDVLSGRFLPPIDAAGHAGPQTLDPGDANFNTGAYALKQQAADDALTRVEQTFKADLMANAGEPVATGTAAPAATGTPNASGTP